MCRGSESANLEQVHLCVRKILFASDTRAREGGKKDQMRARVSNAGRGKRERGRGYSIAEEKDYGQPRGEINNKQGQIYSYKSSGSRCVVCPSCPFFFARLRNPRARSRSLSRPTYRQQDPQSGIFIADVVLSRARAIGLRKS